MTASAQIHPKRPLELADRVQELLASLDEVGRRPRRWSCDGQTWRAGSIGRWGRSEGAAFFDMGDGTEVAVTASRHIHWGPAPEADAPSGWARDVYALTLQMLRVGDLQSAELTWRPPSKAIPALPVGANAAMLLIGESDVLTAYPTLAAFLDGWDGYDRVGDALLAHRGLDCTSPQQFSEHTREGAWQLARRALPGAVRYTRCAPDEVEAWELDWWNAGRDTLSHVATVGGLCEFSAYVGKREHIRPREIHRVRRVVLRGRDERGEPATTVRVAFLNEAMARREARPLLDVGARVVYLDANAEDIELTD